MIKPQQSLRPLNVPAGGASRRAFLADMGAAAVLGMVTSAVELGPLAEAASAHDGPATKEGARRRRALAKKSPHDDPGYAILPLRLIPRLCCAVPPVQCLI